MGNSDLEEFEFFISYDREDDALRQECHSRLKAAFPDSVIHWDGVFDAGRWLDAIEYAIERSSHVIILWTPNSRKSDWVAAEGLEALYQKKSIINVESGARPRLGFGALNSYSISTFIEGIRRTPPGRIPTSKVVASAVEAFAESKLNIPPDQRTFEALDAELKRAHDPALQKFLPGPRVSMNFLVMGLVLAFGAGFGTSEALARERIANAKKPSEVLSVRDQLPWTFTADLAARRLLQFAESDLATAINLAGSTDPDPLAEFVSRWSSDSLVKFAGGTLATASSSLRDVSHSCYSDRYLATVRRDVVTASTRRLTERTTAGGASRADSQSVCAIMPADADLIAVDATFPSKAPNARTKIDGESDTVLGSERSICRRFEVKSPSGMNNMNVGVHGTGLLSVTYVLHPSEEQKSAIASACHFDEPVSSALCTAQCTSLPGAQPVPGSDGICTTPCDQIR